MTSNEYNNTLKTKRLILKIIGPDDIRFVYKALSNNKVTKYYGVHFDSIDATRKQMQWYEQLLQEQKGVWWKVNLREPRNEIGACGFNNWDQKANTAELGFWLLTEFQGKGYMREALSEVLGYGFGAMGLEKIKAEVERANTASIRLLTRVGFTRQKEKSFTEIKNEQSIVVDIYEMAGSSPD